MRLTKVTLRNFRSFWSEGDEPSAEIDLTDGVNYLVGSNNVGKSNVLRAIALALDPHGKLDPAIDRPEGRSAPTTITLELHAGEQRSAAVKQLLEKVDASGQQGREPTLASEGIVRFEVTFDKERDEYFQVTRHFKGPVQRDTKASHIVKMRRLERAALEAFHDLVRFVDIRSGEDLQSLLQRGFKEILTSAAGAENTKSMKAAEDARLAYIDALGQVLRPVAGHVQRQISRYVRGIEEVDLVPNVPPVEDAIADARVFLKDAVRTALEQKGTGVRGAMLLLLLSFIADSAKSVVIFGIEEPEAFLHPEAHRELGAGLERFRQREDVTLLVTTHSPFIFRTEGGDGRSTVFLVRKDGRGRSTVSPDDAQAARQDLLGSRVLTALLQKGDEVPDDTKLVLVVEGWTDQRYLELAAERLGLPLDGIHLVHAEGALAAAVQAATLRGMHKDERLVAALFDSDEEGRKGQDILVDKFKFKKRAEVLCYDHWIQADNVPVEAEDLFGKPVIEAFLAEPGNDAYLAEKMLRPTVKVYHYGLTADAKGPFVEWLEKQTDPAMFEGWKKPIEALKKIIAEAEARAEKRRAYEAAQGGAKGEGDEKR